MPAPAVFGPNPRSMNCALGHVLRRASRIEMVLHGENDLRECSAVLHIRLMSAGEVLHCQAPRPQTQFFVKWLESAQAQAILVPPCRGRADSRFHHCVRAGQQVLQ